MIWHVLEIWVLLAVTFVVGCVLGSLLYLLLAGSPFARRQEEFAGVMGGSVDRIKQRFGLAPVWRPGHYPRERRYSDDRDTDYHEPPAYRPDAAPARRKEEELPPYPQPAIDSQGAAEDVGNREPAAIGEGTSDDLTDWHDESGWEDDEHGPGSALEPVEAATLEPRPEPEPEPEPELPSMRPMGLSAPRNGVPDDLQRIRGIGKKNEELLNSLGIFHISQIAAWTPAEARWVAARMAFPERVERDDWIGQATVLASGGNTDYVKAPARAVQAEEDAPESEGEGPE